MTILSPLRSWFQTPDAAVWSRGGLHDLDGLLFRSFSSARCERCGARASCWSLEHPDPRSFGWMTVKSELALLRRCCRGVLGAGLAFSDAEMAILSPLRSWFQTPDAAVWSRGGLHDLDGPLSFIQLGAMRTLWSTRILLVPSGKTTSRSPALKRSLASSY